MDKYCKFKAWYSDSMTSYYSITKDLWNELDGMIPLPSCDCDESNTYEEHL